MNRIPFFCRILSVLLCAVLLAGMLPVIQPQTASAATARQMESLNRGLVAVKTDSGVFLSWRLLGTEAYSTAFNVYRDGALIASNITGSTNYLDTAGSSGSTYYVRSVAGGSEVTQSDSVRPWAQNYLDVPLQKPAATTLNGTSVTYSANDATVADVDGDGAYEIILKWDPSNAQDNSKSGYTSNVYVDCYELDGTLRWRIDLGRNIRAGAHYTQFIAYDLNGDGRAEVAMKTADGTVDGKGNVIGDANADYRNSSGYILSGPEYLTLFDGRTGEALVTNDYNPPRGTVSSWGDNYGNRVDRFLAGVAYFDGKTPSLVMCRGYYTRCVIVSYEYKGGKLTQEWVFDSNTSGNSAYAGEGNHNLSIADVDGDGFDEIVYGSAVIDHDGTGLYATGNGHGDALHVGDFDPGHSGLEIFQVHEETASDIESIQFRDAKTGKTIWSKKLSKDTGRGLILNIDPDFYPYVTLASGGNYHTAGGNSVTSSISGLGINFAAYWDGDLYREGLDGTTIRKWDYTNDKVVTALTGSNVHSCNGTKSTPSLSGDILGDWREEVIWPTSDDTALRIYTTTAVTNAKLYTLMHDSQYRCAIAWQNVAYNQPPHTSYYIGPDMPAPGQPSIYTVGSYELAAPDGSSGGSDAPGATEPSTEATQPPASGSSYVHNFTTSDKNSTFYTITGNTSTSKGSTTYNGESLTKCLKMESSTTISFTAPTAGTLTLVFGGSTSASGKSVKIDGAAQTVGSDNILTIDVAAGSHTITKGDSINLFYMVYASESTGGEEHTHSYTSSVTTAATCTTAGVRTYTCSCGDSYTESIAAIGHSYSSSVTTAATCTSAGVRTYTCAGCGNSYTESIAAAGHSYSNGSCTVCGAADPSASEPSTEATEPSTEATEPSEDPSEPVVTAGAEIHNFTDDGYTSTFYTFAGDQLTNGKHGTYTYDFGSGTETLNNALKFDSKGSVVFTPTANGTLTIAVASSSAGRTVLVNDGSSDIGTITIDTAKKLFVLTVDVSANVQYTVKRGSGESGLYYIAYIPESTGGDVHTHSYTAVVTAPTCTAAGYTTYTCSCGDSYTADEVAALGHSYSSAVTTAPSCEGTGVRTYTCGNCGNSYTEVIAATGHNMVVTDTVGATCEMHGYDTYECANGCGYYYMENNGQTALGHSYSSAVTTAPSCEGTGVRTYTCGNCGDSYTESIAALGHSYSSVVTAPTCTAAGYTTHTCSCGHSYTADEVAALGHSYSSTVTTAPSCEGTGVRTYTCGNCGDSYTESIAALGHSYKAVVTAPTCTAAGYTTHTCSACGDSYTDSEVAALGHSYSSAVTTAPSCEGTGVRTYTCSNCGDSYTESIAALGHSYKAVVTAPTCTAAGYTTYTCSVCGDSYTSNEVAATGHSYVDGVCSVCGAEDPNYVAPVDLFKLSGANVVLGNDLTMNFALLASNLNGTDYYAEIVKHNPDGTTVTTTYPFSEWTPYANGMMYLITLDGLVAKQMSDKVEVTVYTGDGVQASYTWEDSIRDYAIRQLNTTSNTAKVFTVLADMLNYGAAAQVQFNYNTSDLANATMTDTHKSYATAALDFSQYTNNQVVGDNFFGTILALETNIKMGVFFRGTGYEGYTAKVSYRDHNGNAVSYEVAGVDFDATYAANGMYGIMVDTLVAGDVYQVVTVEVYNGSTLVASVSESMESYVVRQSASLLPIYEALMKFMVSSYNYSHN